MTTESQAMAVITCEMVYAGGRPCPEVATKRVAGPRPEDVRHVCDLHQQRFFRFDPHATGAYRITDLPKVMAN